MRNDLLRWGGVFSVLLGVLFAVVLVLGFAMGANIYEDSEPAEILTDIDDNQLAFALWAILGITTSLLYFPAALGYLYAAREEDRPYLALPAGLFGLAAAISVVGYGMGIMLVEVADNYMEATGPTKEALLHDGETLQSMVLVFGGVAFTPFALGMLAIGILTLRSGFVPRWVAWPTVAIGVIGAFPIVGFIAIVPGRILWLLIFGVIMLRRSRSESPVADMRASPLPA
ncbi:MAG: DUF4386 family protein [Gammaproteobacteria bacterium]